MSIRIENSGKKIVHVTNHALMPGDEIVVADAVAETPAIQILAKHGILRLTKSVEKSNPPKNETPAVTVAEITETPAETPAAPAKKTRASKTAAAE